MITVLLEKIITILEGWIQSFTSHAQHVEDKLDSLDQTASDIETNTEPISDIADNTAAVITPIQNIKSNTDSIKQSSQTSTNNTTAILNNVSTLSTNTGRAAAFAEDCANNTLDIKDKVTTIASDTTQLRADSANIAADVSSINQAIGYYVANTLVTEDSEGTIANFDTDLEDYLQDLKVTIPADLTGFSGITLTKCGKNLINVADTTLLINNAYYASVTLGFAPKAGTTYTLSFDVETTATPFSISVGCGTTIYSSDITTKTNQNNGRVFITFTPTEDQLSNRPNIFLRAPRYSKLQTFSTTLKNFMLEIGSTVTTYEPYKAMTYPVSFGSTITDGAEADLLSGLVKVNTTPESFIQIQPIAVRTYKGVNNIYSDIGTSALTYRETLKHYLDKNNQ